MAVIGSFDWPFFTERDAEFLRLHDAGLSTAQIAQQMGVTRGRINGLRPRALEKRRKAEQFDADRLPDNFLIEDTPLSVRTRNALKNESILTIADADAATDAQLLRIPNFAHKSLVELRRFLDRREFAETVAADG